MVLLCSVTLTEEHFQFNEAAHEAVEIYGVLSISVTADDGLQHCAVDVKTWGREIPDRISTSC